MSREEHASAAAAFIADRFRTDWHNETLWYVRQKRDRAAAGLPEWERLREWASQIKSHTLSRLDHYLEEFERNARSNGVQVHWAADGEEHNRIIYGLIRDQGARQVVKSKSMLTEECHLNAYLGERGIRVLDTDLGEYIVQLREERPSHIVLPAIHLKREDVSSTFHEHLDTEPGNSDPGYLAGVARARMRKEFVTAEVAITGVNFAVAETGGVVVCTNEGNADMGAHSAGIHIASMGMEKLIPERRHLGVFLRLLGRSATGQPITVYSSHFNRPAAGKQLHVVIVDNGRSRQLGRKDFRNSLKCIRCAACFNTCPVYRRSGGHSYHSAVGGPIGSILNPNLDLKASSDLPFASTLCGSCSHVCPVKIDIHEQLWKWRQEIVSSGEVSRSKRAGMRLMSWVLSRPGWYRFAGGVGRWLLRKMPWLLHNRLNVWYKGREMPSAPEASFREWYAQEQRRSKEEGVKSKEQGTKSKE